MRISNGPLIEGGMAATSAESQRGGKSVSTSAVGAGDEQISIGPDVPNSPNPPVMAQKLVHEGLRVKMTIQTTSATYSVLPDGSVNPNAGPGPGAPPGERCKWLKNEVQTLKLDEAYFKGLASVYPAGSPAQKDALARRDMRKNKREALEDELLDC